jgi:hypothetical protein
MFAFSQSNDAQISKDPQHLITIGYGDAFLASWLNVIPYNHVYGDFSVSYMYHPIKYVGVGLNFVSYLNKEDFYYYHDIYNSDGTISNITTKNSKMIYSFAIAPEVRGRYLNKPFCSLYSAGSIGYAYNGLDKEGHLYWQVTYLGFDVQFGKKNNIVIGMEVGTGMKGFINGHVGWRF